MNLRRFGGLLQPGSIPFPSLVDWFTCCQFFDLFRDRAHAEFIRFTKHPLACCFRGNSSKNDTIQQGVTTKTIVAVHTASHLTCSVEARDDVVVKLLARSCLSTWLVPRFP